MKEVARSSGNRLQVVVDKFEATSNRTNSKPVPFENVYGILPGSDPVLAKTVFIVSGHVDSRASDVMDPQLDSPGADDDASGVAVSLECARLLTRLGPTGPAKYRATLLFAAVSGEEQGLLGAQQILKWVKERGYAVGGMLDDDIVGADTAPGGPHRVRVFSGNGDIEDCDSPARELARAIEEIDGRSAIRMIFRQDRYGRGGNDVGESMPFTLGNDLASRIVKAMVRGGYVVDAGPGHANIVYIEGLNPDGTSNGPDTTAGGLSYLR